MENNQKLLAVSIKNEALSLGCVTENEVLFRLSLSVDHTRTADEYALLIRDMIAFRGYAKDDFSHAMLCSVVPQLTETVKTALEQFLEKRVFLLTGGTKTGLSILTDYPTELGSDLVASAVGAKSVYAPPFLLVDFGTATTICAVDKNGAFIGCAIAPGISLSGKALSDAAALLPDVAHRAPTRAIGKNTEESLRSGSIFGAAAMIDGMLSRMEAEMGEENITVIASGKIADAVIPHCLHRCLRNDDLLLRGLYEIDQKNKRK